jgi:hypothetical protein
MPRKGIIMDEKQKKELLSIAELLLDEAIRIASLRKACGRNSHWKLIGSGIAFKRILRVAVDDPGLRMKAQKDADQKWATAIKNTRNKACD